MKLITLHYYKIKSVIDVKSLITLSQTNNENIVVPGWKSHIIITTKKLPKFFPWKILCTYKGEYHTSFIAELVLNHINENNLDFVISISSNILSKPAYHIMKRPFLSW